MGREVRFSFSTDAERQEFEVLARERGLSLSQFVRWCAYKYRMDCSNGAEASRAYRARKRGEDRSSITRTVEAQ